MLPYFLQPNRTRFPLSSALLLYKAPPVDIFISIRISDEGINPNYNIFCIGRCPFHVPLLNFQADILYSNKKKVI